MPSVAEDLGGGGGEVVEVDITRAWCRTASSRPGWGANPLTTVLGETASRVFVFINHFLAGF